MKRIGVFCAVLASGIALFFLSTFSFLAMQGHLNEATLTRLPLIGKIFSGSGTAATSEQIEDLTLQICRLRVEMATLEVKLRENNRLLGMQEKNIQPASWR